MGREGGGLYLLVIGSSQFLLHGYQVLLPDRSLHSGGGGHLAGSTEGYPALGRGGWLTPLMQV